MNKRVDPLALPDMTRREQQIIQTAVDEAVRLIAKAERWQVTLLQKALMGIADRCIVMSEEELADEIETSRIITGEPYDPAT
jgi:hypothetical protein